MAADGSQFAFTPEVELSTAPAWEKVKQVCDEAGVLMGEGQLVAVE